MADTQVTVPEVSVNLGYELPNATVGARRLQDVQKIKSALVQIDAIIASLPDSASVVSPTQLDTAINSGVDSAINSIKGGVVAAADSLFKVKGLIDNVESNVVALNSDVGALTDLLADKADVNHTHAFTKADVGLNNVDNTSDLNKPISTATQTALNAKVNTSAIGAANGIASLDATGKVPSGQLPSYVDDVVEGTNLAAFPTTGETGKIYVALDTNKTYRWGGSTYSEISSGAVTSVAGKTGVVSLVKADVGLGNVDNTSDANKPISTATQTALNSKVDATSAQTLSNKTIDAGIHTNGYTEESATNNSGSAFTVDLANGSYQTIVLTANTTLTFPSATVAGKGLTLLIKQDATGNRTVTWPSNVVWPNGTAPTITPGINKTDKLVFTTDGNNWLGSVAGQNY